MSVHLNRQFDKLKKQILHLGAHVEDRFDEAIRAVQNRDVSRAEAVIRKDAEIDAMEIDVEEECLHTLACYQPVAQDLRFTISVLKINNDLERIADHAVNISEQAKFLAEQSRLDDPPFDVVAMAGVVRTMLKGSLDALVNSDVAVAETVVINDDRVDDLHKGVFVAVEQGIRENPHQARQYIHYLSISRQLERIADLAVNIAEDVLYMAKGNIIRHHHEEVRAAHSD